MGAQSPMMLAVSAILATPIRAVVFLVGFASFWMEVASDWLVGARAKTEYVREGSCRRCGRCCRCLALVMPKGVSSRDWLVRFCVWWHGFAMNFRYVAEESDCGESPDGERRSWLIYRCGYYKDGEDGGGCSIYPFRHRLCRFFPRQKLYGRPSLHEDCGFKFVKREVLCKRKMQREAGVPPFDELLSSGRASRTSR